MEGQKILLKRILLCIMVLLCLLLAACQMDTVPMTTELATKPTVSTTVAKENTILSGANVYSIVYADDCDDQIKQALELFQEALCGIAIVSDEEAMGEYEILVGNTNRDESAVLSDGLAAFDYRISVVGEKLVLTGGSDTAVINAITTLTRGDAITIGDDGIWAIPADYCLFFDGAENRAEYIADPNLFLVNWAHKFDVPEWMLDYEEKMATFRDPGGRMMSSHHRGGMLYYPENSIEAIISSIKMGADNIEIDVRITRDGIPVLLHNESLRHTTDWKDKKGKDGLPESEYIVDWKLEELRQLRLLTYDGKVTDYLIPTLEEALTVSKGRTTLRLDKTSNAEWDTYIFPVIQKTEAWSTCILPDWYTMELKTSIAETIMELSGEQIMFYHSLWPEECAQWEEQVNALLDAGYLPIMRWETFRTSGIEMRVEKVSPYLEQIRQMVRINADVQASNQCKERAEVWNQLHEIGIGLMLIDNVLLIQQYIAENYEPTPH